MQMKKRKFVICIAIAFVAGGLLSGILCTAVAGGSSDRYSKLDEIYDMIESNYYDDIDEDALLEEACRGLVSGLDDTYSSYMTADEYEEWKVTATGEYSGVGITFSEDEDGNFIIVSVTEDSPAEEAGLKEGDIIFAADDKTYDDTDLIAAAIRGEAGTEVKITYSRDGEEDSVTLTREEITQHSVYSEMLDGNIGYIYISSFIESTGDDFKEALEEIEEEGAEGLILDLRDNGGGLVTECVEVADEFLDEGAIVYVEDKDGNRSSYNAEDGKTDLKTVVLVNENSASASEILAAALQDNGYELVGATTYGKGVIQSTAELSDGSALKLTIMQYFSPDGNAINEKGVEPDYAVEYDEDAEDDAQLDKALSLF